MGIHENERNEKRRLQQRHSHFVLSKSVNFLNYNVLHSLLLVASMIFSQGMAFQVGVRFVSSHNCAYMSRTERNSIPLLPLNQQGQDKKITLWSSTSSSQGEIVTDKITDKDVDDVATTNNGPKLCFWRPPNGWWEERIKFEDLQVRQNLTGVVFQDLLDGKTGPKVFFDCGVGKIDSDGEWKIVNGMMRLGKRNMKKSVAQKKSSRFRQKKDGVELYVSRIFPEAGRFEVMTSLEDVDYTVKSKESMIPASSLKIHQELEGTVVNVEPYGAFIDVGANRNGLLHIQKVADLMGQYIDKEKGLQEAGLERGARVRVQVLENQKKRLFLDFPNDVKEAAAEELKQQEGAKQKEVEEKEKAAKIAKNYISEDEAAAWAEFAALDTSAPVDDKGSDDEEEEVDGYNDHEDYDEYDEDRDIEDSLGLGMY